MRTGWIVLGCLLLMANPCQAATVMLMEKAVLEVKEKEEEAFRQTLRMDSYVKWPWMELNISNKLTFPEQSDQYHNSKFQLEFTRFMPGLGLDLDYQYNPRYTITEVGMDYRWKPLKGLKVQVDVDAGSKSGRVESSKPYRNHWNYQQLYLTYTWKDWNYKWRLNRTDKEYPERKYYTSLKYDLMQEISKELNSKLKAGVTYHEATADYPYDTSLTRDSWKKEWTLWLNYKQGRNQRWKGEYRVLSSERGFDPEQDNRYFNLEYQQWNKKWRLVTRWGYSEVRYFTDTVIWDPDDEGNEDEVDVKSRNEKRITVELSRYFTNKLTLGCQFFALEKDYLWGPSKHRQGCVASAAWKLNNDKIQIRLVASPWGNLQTDKSIYQLKLEYNPKDVID